MMYGPGNSRAVRLIIIDSEVPGQQNVDRPFLSSVAVGVALRDENPCTRYLTPLIRRRNIVESGFYVN